MSETSIKWKCKTWYTNPFFCTVWPLFQFSHRSPCRFFREKKVLRGPAAILFTSNDACSDGIVKLIRACVESVSHNYRAICCKTGHKWARRKGNGPPPVTGTEALLIVKNAFHCNGSPYGFNCRVSRGTPKKWPQYRIPARVRHHTYNIAI